MGGDLTLLMSAYTGTVQNTCYRTLNTEEDIIVSARLIPSTIELDHFLLVAEVSARPHTDQLTRVTTHVPVRFCSIHRWLPKACLQVESSADENVVT
jgi:hypothetical protein